MIRRRALLGLAVLATARCGSPPPPPPSLALDVMGGADQNPDPSGHPTPVAIHLYQLADSSAFLRADVFALTDHEAATLGADDLGSEEFILMPGARRSLSRELKPGTRLLGVAALFRDIDHATWRAIAPVAAHGTTKLALRTAGITVTLGPD